MTTQAEVKRLKILDEGEVAALFVRPGFTDEERQEYFSLTPVENAALKDLAIKLRIYCILQLGYFRARQQFFALAWPIYAIPYVLLAIVAYREAPLFFWVVAGYLLVLLVLRWPRMRREHLPELLEAANNMLGRDK
jgi:hypothetical protein